MSFRPLSAFQALFAQSGDALSKTETLVFAALVSHSTKTGRAWPSQDLLAVETRMDRRVVMRAIAGLAKKTWIKVTKNGTAKDGTTHREYELTPPAPTKRDLHAVKAKAGERRGARQVPRAVHPVHHGGGASQVPRTDESAVPPVLERGAFGAKARCTPCTVSDQGTDLELTKENPPASHGGGPGGFALSLSGAPEVNPEKPRKPKKAKSESAGARYAAAFARGHLKAGATSFAPPPQYAVLARVAQHHARLDDRPIVGDALLGWFEDNAAEWRRATRGEEQFCAGYSPTKFEAWLNAGRPRARGVKAADLHQRPPTTGRAWSMGGDDSNEDAAARVAVAGGLK